MIVIDGEQFKIDVLSVKRSADFLDKYAERLANGHLRRELIGVYFNYKLQFGPGLDRKEYARLWDKLTEPVEFHEVTVPDEDGDYGNASLAAANSNNTTGNRNWNGSAGVADLSITPYIIYCTV